MALASSAMSNEEDTPMNRALRRQAAEREQQRAKEQAALSSRGQLSGQAEDGSYDGYEKRLRGRAVPRTKPASSKKSAGVQPSTLLGGEWGAAPKPASALQAKGSAGQSAAANSYFGTQEASPNLPAAVPHPAHNTQPAPAAATGTAPAAASYKPHDKSSKAAPPSQPQRAGGKYAAEAVLQKNSHMQAPTPAPTPVPAHSSTAYASAPAPAPAAAYQDPSLPDGWDAVTDEGGNTYYYHRVTRVSRWDKPDAALAAAQNERLDEQRREIEERQTRRMAELQVNKAAADAEAVAKQDMQASIRQIIQRWAKHPTIMNRTRCVADLLATAHTVISLIPPDGIVADAANKPLTDASPVADVKKAFFRAVRFVHPDKIPVSAPLETRALAEGVFVFLTEEFDNYKLVLGI